MRPHVNVNIRVMSCFSPSYTNIVDGAAIAVIEVSKTFTLQLILAISIKNLHLQPWKQHSLTPLNQSVGHNS